MSYWWVNQNRYYAMEVARGHLACPKTRSDGTRNPYYDTMEDVRPGDVVLSYSQTCIKAIGVVLGLAYDGPRPTYRPPIARPYTDGWLLPVAFAELEHPVRPKDHIERLRPLLPKKYSPLQVSGNGIQSVYLAWIPDALARELITLLGEAHRDAGAGTPPMTGA
jgi:putative restriction endonuclease